MFGFIDTATEDIERLKKARKNIHTATIISMSMEIFFLGVIFILLLVNAPIIFIATSIIFAVYFAVSSTALVIKREIYSIMIFLKGLENG